MTVKRPFRWFNVEAEALLNGTAIDLYTMEPKLSSETSIVFGSSEDLHIWLAYHYLTSPLPYIAAS